MPDPKFTLDVPHLAMFGAIIHTFAHFEMNIHIVVSAIIQASLVDTTLVMSGLGYQAKFDALRSLLGAYKLPEGHNEKIEAFMNTFEKHATLRNDMAHQVWRSGTKPHTIKPMKLTARGGKAKFKGVRSDDTEYSLDDLKAICTELTSTLQDFVKFLTDEGYKARIAVKTPTTKSISAELPGQPSK